MLAESRHGEQVRQRLQSHAARREKYQRHHDQTDNVIDKKRRGHPRDEDDGGQLVTRLQTGDDARGSTEEACYRGSTEEACYV